MDSSYDITEPLNSNYSNMNTFSSPFSTSTPKKAPENTHFLEVSESKNILENPLLSSIDQDGSISETNVTTKNSVELSPFNIPDTILPLNVTKKPESSDIDRISRKLEFLDVAKSSPINSELKERVRYRFINFVNSMDKRMNKSTSDIPLTNYENQKNVLINNNDEASSISSLGNRSTNVLSRLIDSQLKNLKIQNEELNNQKLLFYLNEKEKENIMLTTKYQKEIDSANSVS